MFSNMENTGAGRETAARQTLTQLTEDRANAAPRTRAPAWYHLAMGLAVAAFVWAFALPDEWFPVAVSASGVVAVLLGVLRPWITGTQADPWAHQQSLRIGLAQFTVVAAISAAGILAHASTTASWGRWVLAAAAILAAIATLVLGRRMDRALAGAVRTGT